MEISLGAFASCLVRIGKGSTVMRMILCLCVSPTLALAAEVGRSETAATATITGAITKVRGAHIEGWSCDILAPAAALQVKALLNGAQVATGVANEVRTGLDRHASHCEGDAHGFTIDLPNSLSSCVQQEVGIAVVPASGGTPFMLSSSVPTSAVIQRPPTGKITITGGTSANTPTNAMFVADDVGLTIVNVVWMDGANVVGQTTHAPHTVQWTPKPGKHSLRAIATDQCGLSAQTNVAFDASPGAANVSPPTVSFFDPGLGRSYFTLGNLPLRVLVGKQTSPLSQIRLYYAMGSENPTAAYQPLSVISSPTASKYVGAWAIPRPVDLKSWDGIYAVVVEAEDVAGRIGMARIDLPVAPPTYGEAQPFASHRGIAATGKLLLNALFEIDFGDSKAADTVAEAWSPSGSDGALKSITDVYTLTIDKTGLGSGLISVVTSTGTVQCPFSGTCSTSMQYGLLLVGQRSPDLRHAERYGQEGQSSRPTG